MNLKEKAKEAKEYGEVKSTLVDLIQDYITKYKEYENLYKNSFENWVNKIITEFEEIFKSEGFTVTTKISNYIDVDSQYKTIKAVLYDLEFELLITVRGCSDIRFLQNKPEAEKKNIVIRPTIKQHYIKGDKINISNIYSLEQYNERVKNAEFSVAVMKDFIIEIKKEIELLLSETEKIKITNMKGIATPTEKYGFENKDASYGEFGKFGELIERI